MDTKICNKCFEEKKLEQFYIFKGYPRSICKTCFNQRERSKKLEPIDLLGKEAIQLIKAMVQAKEKHCKIDLMCCLGDMEKFVKRLRI